MVGSVSILAWKILLATLAAPGDSHFPARPPASGEISITSADQPPGGGEVCLRGRLTDEGIECPALRSDGELYTLAGDASGFEVGDEVCVCGAVVDVSFCMQGTTIAVTQISSADQDCPRSAPE